MTRSTSKRGGWALGGRGRAAVAAGLVAVAAVGAAALAGGGRPAAGVDTVRVERTGLVRRVEAEGTLRPIHATVLRLPATVREAVRVAWIAAEGVRVETGEPVVVFDDTEMVKALTGGRDDLAETEIKIAKQRSASAAEAANLARDAELADAELDAARRFGKRDELLYSRHEILESEIDERLAAERREHAAAAGRLGRRLADTELELLAIDRREAERAIAEAREGLAGVEIVAPHDGVLVLHRDWRGAPVRVGDTLWPGQPVGEIPSLDAVEAEVFVLEADAGGLAVGRPATVSLDAHPERSYTARVERVDALAKPRIPGSPVQYFAVTLAFEESPASGLAPGQRLHATLELERVDEALVVPRQAVFDDGAGKRVFRRADGGFEPVAVTLGPSGLGRVVIASGVTEGDELALVDPGRPAGGRGALGDAVAGGGAAGPAVPGG